MTAHAYIFVVVGALAALVLILRQVRNRRLRAKYHADVAHRGRWTRVVGRDPGCS